MSEATPDLRGVPRAEAWATVAMTTDAVLEGVDDPIAAMATVASVVHHAFGFLWTGFYRVVGPELLRVGPYQGTIGCVEIDFARGVCGAAARARRSVVVHDVHAFPGHITCDGRSASELVVPVFNGRGELIAVFDLDADVVGAFTDVDARGAERVVQWFASHL